MKNAARICACLLLVTCLAACNSEDVQNKPDVTITGVDEDSALGEWLKKAVIDKYEDTEEEGDFRGLRRDAVRAVKAKGYYEPQVRITSRKSENPVIEVVPGPRYSIADISVRGISGFSVRTIKAGEPLDAQSVLAAQLALAEDVQRETCAFTLETGHEVRLDDEEHAGSITYIVNAGPKASFGKVRFEGAPNIDRDYLAHFVNVQEGECWNRLKIEDMKEKLLGTGLIASVREDVPAAPDAGGRVDIVFHLTERAPRSVRLGLSYYTDEGPGIAAEWEHRNLRGGAEKLGIHTRMNMIDQSLGTNYTKPYFMGNGDRALNLSANLGREETDAYIDRGLALAASIDNRFHKYLKASAGVAVELSSIIDKNDNDSETTFGLFSTPVQLVYDNRDSPLNPTRGYWGRVRAEPFFDILGEASPFLKASVSASTYFSLTEDRDTIIAVRGRLGSLIGSGTENVPASKRFYAGGGGSIRGFGYQEAGPQENGDPAGGRSVVETSVELRRKFNDTMGGVIFVDGGGAYDSNVPDFDEGYYIGAGAGFRYYTGFGPIRFDIATPITNRDTASAAVQFYVSIGQAF